MASSRRGAATLRDFVSTVLGVAVITPVREGTLRLRDHPPAIAGITWVTSGVIAILLVGLVAANPLRATTGLIAVTDESGNSILPAFLVPAILFLLALAIALVLAGTQRLLPWQRILLLVASTAILAALIRSSALVVSDRSTGWIPWVLLAALTGYCLLIWTGRTRAAADFVVLLVLTMAIAVWSYRGFTAGAKEIDIRFDLATTTTLMLTLTTLAMPVAFTSGLAATKFGASILEQAGGFTARRTSTGIASVILLAVCLHQIVSIAPEFIGRWSELGPLGALGGIAGGVVTIGLCALVWRLTHRFAGARTAEHDVSSLATVAALPVAYALTAPLIASNLLALIGSVIVAGPGQRGVVDAMGRLGGETAVGLMRAAVVVGLLVAGVWMTTRHRPRMAAILVIDAIMLAVVLFGVPVLQSAHLAWKVDDLGTIGLAVGIALFARWAVRGSLTPQRLTLLFTIVLLSGLIRQGDFFEVPFEFLIGASTITVLVVGLAWGFLTDGGETHEDGPRSPRDGKLLFFLGRVLFSITIAAWAVIGKQIDQAEQLGRTAELAVLTIGTAFLIVRVLELASGLGGDVGVRPRDGAVESPGVHIGDEQVPTVHETAALQYRTE